MLKLHPSIVAILGLALIACSSDSAAPTPVSTGDRGSETASAALAATLPMYGLNRPTGELRGCRRAAFRAFDFWLGQWNVYDPLGNLGGTNQVTEQLGGCAIEESWTDGQGGRGRSLNTYDSGSGQWNQLWTDFSGLALILAGTTFDQGIRMSGDTPTSFGGPIISNRITWLPIAGSRNVSQIWDQSSDGRATWVNVFFGDYRRQDNVTPAPEALGQQCGSPSFPRYHWFDFLIGQWDVRVGNATGTSVGSLSVAKDLSDCLVESKFQGASYQGKAFSAFHFPTRSWHRDWIDEDGVRVAVVGALVNGAMVMTGQRKPASGPLQDLRGTWTPVSTSQVNELWEISTDGGQTWRVARQFALVRRT